MANRLFDLPQTKGFFNLKGIVHGVLGQNFYTEKKAKNNKNFRMVNFGVEYDKTKTVYVNLNGMPQDKVYFSKKENPKEKKSKTITKEVTWENRMKKDPDGYQLIGVTVGLTKTTNDKGKEVNDNKILTNFDACKYISENLKDDSSIFVTGDIDFSSFINSNGDIQRSIKYVPKKMYLAQDINFEKNAELEPKEQNALHSFHQRIIYMGIEPEVENDEQTGRFILHAKIVTYNDIVDTEFIVTTKGRALWFKKNMKPYQAIDVGGVIAVSHMVEEVENNDDPFEEDPTSKRVNSSSKTELIIVSRAEESRDNDTYTEKNIEEAIQKIRNAKDAEKKFEGTAKKSDKADKDDGEFEDFDEDPFGDDDMPF